MQVTITLDGEPKDVTDWVAENRLRTTTALATRLALCEAVNREPYAFDQRTAELRAQIAGFKSARSGGRA